MNNNQRTSGNDKVESVVQDLLIATLGMAGVTATDIRKIVGCNMNKVTRITKYIRRGKTK